MANRVEIFDVECAASTPQATPVEVAVPFDPGLVEKVEVIIPDGHAGLTGIALAIAHQPVIPFNRRSEPTAPWRFIEGNDEEIPFKLEDYPDSGAWSAWVFNTDVNAHKWQLRFEINELMRAGAPTTSAPAPLVLTPAGEPEGGEAPSSGGETPAPPPPAEEPTTPEPTAPPPEGAAPPPVEGAAPEAPPEPAPPPETDQTEGESSAPAPGAPSSPAPKVHPKAPPVKSRFVIRTSVEELPAGGWLPHGARFTKERTDQGQDGITDWRGRIVAPGEWECIAVLHDRPFPDGFGPAYPVLRITTGRFAGHDWYVGHCTTTVRVGERGHQGATVAHADQGHRDGGGWFEIGEAPGGVPAPMGTGARFVHLFGPLTITHTRRVEVRGKGVKPPKPKETKHALRSPPRPKAPERRPSAPAGTPRRSAPAPAHRPEPARVPVPAARRPSEPPRAAPPPVHRAPPPPPPPRPRPPAPRPVRRR